MMSLYCLRRATTTTSHCGTSCRQGTSASAPPIECGPHSYRPTSSTSIYPADTRIPLHSRLPTRYQFHSDSGDRRLVLVEQQRRTMRPTKCSPASQHWKNPVNIYTHTSLRISRIHNEPYNASKAHHPESAHMDLQAHCIFFPKPQFFPGAHGTYISRVRHQQLSLYLLFASELHSKDPPSAPPSCSRNARAANAATKLSPWLPVLDTIAPVAILIESQNTPGHSCPSLTKHCLGVDLPRKG